MLERILAENADFGLIISSWDLPTMSGLMVLREIRECNIKTPYAMVTKNKNADNISAAKQTGVSEYILKPYDRLEFVERISALLK